MHPEIFALSPCNDFAIAIITGGFGYAAEECEGSEEKDIAEYGNIIVVVTCMVVMTI